MLTTTINTLGRFRWSRLSFGLNVFSKIFQKNLTKSIVIGDIEGVFALANDIIVTGCGETISEAEHGNTVNLELLYSRCKRAKIILNNDKKVIELKEITFLGHKLQITSESMKADDANTKAIIDMLSPANISGVKRFCVNVSSGQNSCLVYNSRTTQDSYTIRHTMARIKILEKAFTDVKKQPSLVCSCLF